MLEGGGGENYRVNVKFHPTSPENIYHYDKAETKTSQHQDPARAKLAAVEVIK